jgi:hypothetical protein
MRPLKALAVTLLLLLGPAPVPARAQSLRLEDPIRQQERWQRNFDMENDRRARDARDRERDKAIRRGQEDILRELRDQESEREARDSWRDFQRGCVVCR